MSAAVETMFWAGREVPWHGLGQQVLEAPNSREAIVAAGLDWEVGKRPLFTSLGFNVQEIPDNFANVRLSDGKVLGLVGNSYKIVQNSEAFDFVDAMIGSGNVKYETAGSLHGGKKIWLLARLPSTDIAGDEVIPFLCFTNSHDGKSAIKAALTPVRVVCQNTLNVALKKATRMCSIRHKGDMQSKMMEAQRVLGLADTYMQRLRAEAAILRAKPLADRQAHEICEALFMPVGTGTLSDRQIKTLQGRRDALKMRYLEAPDLEDIRGTAWGLFNAVTDYVTHEKPVRMTDTYRDKLMDGAIEGYNLVNEAHTLLMAA